MKSRSQKINWSEWVILALLAIFTYELIKQLQAAASNGQSITTSFANAAEQAVADITSPFTAATSAITGTTSFFGNLWSTLISIPLAIVSAITGLFGGASSTIGVSSGGVGGILGTFVGNIFGAASTPTNPLPLSAPAQQSANIAGSGQVFSAPVSQ